MFKKKCFGKIFIRVALLLFIFSFISAATCITPDINSSGKIFFSYSYNIYSINIDGSGEKQLTFDLEGVPSPSPDGSKIVFKKYVSGINKYNIFIMNADGSSIKRLTNFSTQHENYPTFSPDGRKIIFERNPDGYGDEIYMMNTDGTNVERLTNNTVSDDYPSFSPDGTKIVFERYLDVPAAPSVKGIFIMNADGSNVKQLTNFDRNYNDKDPSLSPDGSKIIFCSDRDGDYEIFIMNADGSGQKQITNNSLEDKTPGFSSDGNKIVFIRDLDPLPYSTENDIFLMNIDGSGEKRLTYYNSSILDSPAFTGKPR